MTREDFVEDRADVIDNLMTLYFYAKSGNQEEIEYAHDRYRQGKWYVVERIGDRLIFGPSRFVGYKENNIAKYQQNHGHGKRTNDNLTKDLKIYKKIKSDDYLSQSFNDFLLDLGIEIENKVASFLIPTDIEVKNLKQEAICYFVSPTHCAGYKPQSWKGMLSEQLFAIGWNQDDYTDFTETDIEKEYEGDGAAIKAFKSLKKIKEGDIICATNNLHGIWGIGVAISSYQFSEQIHYAGIDEYKNDCYYSHYIHVAWLKYQPEGYLPKSIFNLPPNEKAWEPYGTISCKNPIPTYITNYLFDENMTTHNIINSALDKFISPLKTKHQIILQGAPGTGKTYTAKNIAEQIIFNSVSEDKNEQATRLKQSEQFKLVQFHPSYTYEDFVRGIIVSTKDSDKPQYLTVNKVLGIFATEALDNWDLSIDNNVKKKQINLQQTPSFDLFKKALQQLIDEQGRIQLTNKVNLFKYDEEAFRYQGSTWGSSSRLLYEDIEQAFDDGNTTNRDIKENINLSGTARQDCTYIRKVLSFYRDFLKNPQTTIDSLTTNVKIERKPYILIIDEINRANLPSVLGELIYALEYRGQAVETMYAVDGDNKLTLPPNLYIIGTMNTADRSVGQIDYAIRRRFAFIDVEAQDLSDTLGDKFASDLFNEVSGLFTDEYLSSEFEAKDVQLGHSYFITSNESPIEMRLEYEIQPILREYVRDGILKAEAKEIIDNLTND